MLKGKLFRITGNFADSSTLHKLYAGSYMDTRPMLYCMNHNTKIGHIVVFNDFEVELGLFYTIAHRPLWVSGLNYELLGFPEISRQEIISIWLGSNMYSADTVGISYNSSVGMSNIINEIEESTTGPMNLNTAAFEKELMKYIINQSIIE